MSKNYNHFTDLTVWQKGHQVVLWVYQITKNFPNEEKYGLTSQMQRSAVSITSNIAEGFGRKNLGEKIQFLHISLGSAYELENQLLVSIDLKLVTDENISQIKSVLTEVQKMLVSAIRKLKDKQ